MAGPRKEKVSLKMLGFEGLKYQLYLNDQRNPKYRKNYFKTGLFINRYFSDL